jgi:hypothetical protein
VGIILFYKHLCARSTSNGRQLRCGHPWHILLWSFTSHYTNLTLDMSTIMHKITLHWKNNTWHGLLLSGILKERKTLKLYVRTNLIYCFWIKVITCYKLTPSKQPTKPSFVMHICRKKENILIWTSGVCIMKECLPIIALSVTKCLAKHKYQLTGFGPFFNPLKTKRRLLYLQTQFVPCCKHFSSWL